MRQFHVYKDSPDKEHQVVDTTGCQSVEEVELLLPPNVDWWGGMANTPQEAIQKAKEEGCQYTPPEEIRNLELINQKLRSMLQGANQ
jgi:hypothetical protein